MPATGGGGGSSSVLVHAARVRRQMIGRNRILFALVFMYVLALVNDTTIVKKELHEKDWHTIGTHMSRTITSRSYALGLNDFEIEQLSLETSPEWIIALFGKPARETFSLLIHPHH